MPLNISQSYATLNITQIYAICTGAFVTFLLSRRLGLLFLQLIYYRLRTFLLKKIFYALLVPRWFYWISVTRIQGLILTMYMIINLFCMMNGFCVRGFCVRPRINSTWLSRTGFLATVNMVLLFFGGRTSLLAELLGISLHNYYFFHHWIGRMVVLESLIHAGLVVAKREISSYDFFQVSGILAVSILTLIAILSFYCVRRAAYELFLMTHFLLGIGAITAVFLHLYSKGWTRFIYPIVAASLWTLNSLARLLRVLYYNYEQSAIKAIRTSSEVSDEQSDQVVIHRYKNENGSRTTALELTVQTRRAMKVGPGQYFYVFFSGMGLQRRLQAHPLMVAWWDHAERAKQLTFLVLPQKGMSLDLTSRNRIRSVVLDGPYGKDVKMEGYESVLLFAKGIGIAGVIGHVLNLVERKHHEDPKYRKGLLTRKVDLIWELDENCQIDWIEFWLDKLKIKDPERLILQVLLYFPQKSSEKLSSEPDPYYAKFFQAKPGIRDLIIEQVKRTPGRTLIAACGNADFTKSIRKVVQSLISQDNNITFEEVEFRPYEKSPVENNLEFGQNEEVELDHLVTKQSRLKTVIEEEEEDNMVATGNPVEPRALV